MLHTSAPGAPRSSRSHQSAVSRLPRMRSAQASGRDGPARALAHLGVGERRRVDARARRAGDPQGSADLPHLALESDGTAVAAWTEGGTVRAATRAPGQDLRRRRARSRRARRSPCPIDAVAVGTRALVLLHAQQGTGATLVAASVDRRVRRRARAGGRDDGADHRGRGGLRADGSALAAYAVAQSPMTISSAARAAAGGWAPAGDVALPGRASRSSSSCSSRSCPTAARCCCSSARGRRRATCRVPTPRCARPRASGRRPSRSIRPPSWPAPISGSRSTRRATPTPSGACPTAACAPRCGRSAAPSRAAQTTALTGRTPRVAGAPDAAGPAGSGVLLGLDRRLGPARAAHRRVDAGGRRHRRLDRRCRARRRRSRASRSPPRPPPRRSSRRRPARAPRSAPARTSWSARRPRRRGRCRTCAPD